MEKIYLLLVLVLSGAGIVTLASKLLAPKRRRSRGALRGGLPSLDHFDHILHFPEPVGDTSGHCRERRR